MPPYDYLPVAFDRHLCEILPFAIPAGGELQLVECDVLTVDIS